MSEPPELNEDGVRRLLEAVYGTMDDTVHLRELAGQDDPEGAYWREWHCEPPPAGSAWRAAVHEWTRPDVGLPVRRIYRIVMLDARTGDADRDR